MWAQPGGCLSPKVLFSPRCDDGTSVISWRGSHWMEHGMSNPLRSHLQSMCPCVHEPKGCGRATMWHNCRGLHVRPGPRLWFGSFIFNHTCRMVYHWIRSIFLILKSSSICDLRSQYFFCSSSNNTVYSSCFLGHISLEKMQALGSLKSLAPDPTKLCQRVNDPYLTFESCPHPHSCHTKTSASPRPPLHHVKCIKTCP